VQPGIDFDPTPCQPAALCYYYKTQDLENSVHRLRTGDYHEGEDGFLIYVPSLHSPSLAPAGKYAVTIYTVAPDTLAEGTWFGRRDELADKLVAAAEAYKNPSHHYHRRFSAAHTPKTPFVWWGATHIRQHTTNSQNAHRESLVHWRPERKRWRGDERDDRSSEGGQTNHERRIGLRKQEHPFSGCSLFRSDRLPYFRS